MTAVNNCRSDCKAPVNQERNAIITTFYECDLGNKGFLDKEDLKVATVALFGYKPSKVEIQRLLENRNGLNLESFTRAMLSKTSARDEDDEIRSIFLAFDFQCHGFLTFNDLQKAASVVAPRLPIHALETAFRQLDRDEDGRVSYRDFEYMMKYDTNLHI